MKKIIIVMIFILFVCELNATIIHIPANYSTIQAGITAATNGDTVLINPGTYVENISYNGKNIMVASLYLTTLDTSYIYSTIIDGNNNGSVVNIDQGEDSTAVLCGLTVANGGGWGSAGGGINCYSSSPTLRNVIITGNNVDYIGGGIYCRTNSSLRLEDVNIIGNNAGAQGGGIYCENATMSLYNVKISNNTADDGGAIIFFTSTAILKNVLIKDNSTADVGGGIVCMSSSSPHLIDVSIVNNSAVNRGGGVYCDGDSNPIFEHVAITGNVAGYFGGGLYCYSSNPTLKAVTIKDNSVGYRGGGIYCNISSYPVFDDENRCSIYSNTVEGIKGMGSDIFAYDCSVIEVIVDTFTVLNPTDYYASPINNFIFDIQHGLENNLISTDLYVSVNGSNSNSGISPDEPFQTISHALASIYADSLHINTIHIAPGIYSGATNGETFPLHMSNYVNILGDREEETILDANHDAGVMEIIYVGNTLIKNITLTNGTAKGGVYCIFSSPIFENVNFVGNHGYSGGGISCWNASSPSLINCIVADNTGEYGIYNDPYEPGNISIMYSDFYNNEVGNFYNCGQEIGVNVNTNANGDSCDVYYNIQMDPLFVDPINYDYRLQWGSPCIDAGDPNSPLDPDSTIVDIGANYYNQGAAIDHDYEEFEVNNLTIYPNPFTASTTISLNKTTKNSEIKIYNIKGQLVRELGFRASDLGFDAVWDGKDKNGREVKNGVYFYKINNNDKHIGKVVKVR